MAYATPAGRDFHARLPEGHAEERMEGQKYLSKLIGEKALEKCVLPVSVRGGIFLLPRLVMRRIKPADRLRRSVAHGSSRAAIAQDT